MTGGILTLNAGSSSVKFALFGRGDPVVEIARGQVEGVGGAARVTLRAADGTPVVDETRGNGAVAGHDGALDMVLRLLRTHHPDAVIAAVGHRVVHGGMHFTAPVAVDDGVLIALRALEPLAPLHQPHNVAGVVAARRAFPGALQVACFDTAFHRDQPWVSDSFALPRAYYDRGIRRYGFHGLSYESVMDRLRARAPAVVDGRVIAAHLGNGASLCAVHRGRAVATTMGFSPLDGLAMGTRCGQIDPGVLIYLMTEDGLDAAAIADLLYKRSGLLGLSGLSNDVRELEAAGTAEATAALDYFVARAVRELGGLVAVLGGLDALVFSGGIGENAWRIRARLCERFGYLGLRLDPAANRNSRPLVSAPDSRVAVHIIPADEESMIAGHTAHLLDGPKSS